MTTGDEFVSIQPKRLLGFLDFRERLLGFFRKGLADITANTYGQNGVLNTPIVLSAFGSDKIQLDNDVVGTDANGHFMITNADLSGRTNGVQVENTLAVDYFVGLRFAEKPAGIQINPRTGFPEFLKLVEFIGTRDDPDSLIDNGDGTLTFVVDSVARPFTADVSNSLSQVGRECLVWKKTPGKTAITEAAALERRTIFLDAGSNKITTVGNFGQATASTTASDYFVLLLGPTVSRQDLSVEPFIEFLGKFTGTGAGNSPGTFDNSGQNILGPVAADLGQITALHHGNLKVRVRADVSDVDETMLEIQDQFGTKVFGVDEDGDTEIFGDLTARGLSFLEDTVKVGADITAGTPDDASNKPRIDFGPVQSFIENLRWRARTGLAGARGFADDEGRFGWTQNAKFRGDFGVWEKDQTSAEATYIHQKDGRLYFKSRFSRPGDTDPWGLGETPIDDPSNVAATGTITTIPAAQIIDGETFTLNDGINVFALTVFELDISGGGVSPGNVAVVIGAADTADQVRDAIISAVNGVGASLEITASNGGAATVSLVNDRVGVQGNQAIIETVADAGFVVSGMSNGTGSGWDSIQSIAIGDDNYTDSFAQFLQATLEGHRTARSGTPGPVLTLGTELTGADAADALTARIKADPTTTGTAFTLLLESIDSGKVGMRFYSMTSPTGGFVLTTNARWDGTNWNKDVAGASAQKLQLAKELWEIFTKEPGENTPWIDTRWAPTSLPTNIAAFTLNNSGAALDEHPTLIATLKSLVLELKSGSGFIDMNSAGDLNIVNGGLGVGEKIDLGSELTGVGLAEIPRIRLRTGNTPLVNALLETINNVSDTPELRLDKISSVLEQVQLLYNAKRNPADLTRWLRDTTGANLTPSLRVNIEKLSTLISLTLGTRGSSQSDSWLDGGWSAPFAFLMRNAADTAVPSFFEMKGDTGILWSNPGSAINPPNTLPNPLFVNEIGPKNVLKAFAKIQLGVAPVTLSAFNISSVAFVGAPKDVRIALPVGAEFLTTSDMMVVVTTHTKPSVTSPLLSYNVVIVDTLTFDIQLQDTSTGFQIGADTAGGFSIAVLVYGAQ